jgi:hypothetical protein
VTGVGNAGHLKKYIENDMFPIQVIYRVSDKEVKDIRALLNPDILNYLKDERIRLICFQHHLTTNGKGVNAIMALKDYAKRLSIYGWDQYLPEIRGDVTAIQQYCILTTPQQIANYYQMIVIYLCGLNWANRLKNVTTIKNYGRIAHVDRFQGLTKRLDRLFYQPD